MNRRGQTNSPTRHTAPRPKAWGLKLPMCCATVPTCEKKSPGMRAMDRPSQSLTCDSAISTAMPLVKPMTMLTGTKRTSVPSRNRPSSTSSTPAQAVEMSRLATPWRSTMP